ncbi:MAG: YidC/Oxa1 family rane protein insertase [Blastocatellia bacterium]|jgi:YidC/Oxa1 family membrane protein insertase|nr:YidC/Oxa1 family rane protein insertase [Blastocatellia bacterium]
MQQQQRFIVALVASAAVLILWNVLFPPVKPPQPNANANANNQAVAQSSAQPTSPATVGTTPTPAQAVQSASPSPGASPAPTPDNVPQRKLRITTPLYDATFDTHGAVATSWIVKKVRRSDGTWRELNSAGSTKINPKPLELISTPPAGVAPEQLFRTFQVVTGDAAVDGLLANRNFKASGTNSESGDATIDIPNGSKQIEFTVHDDLTGLDVNKRMTFSADRYIAEIEVRLTRNNQPVPKAQLVIGPNIGDQGIDHYTFYSFAPEGVAVLDGQVRRINAVQVHSDRKSTGTINWILEGIGIKSVVNKPADRETIDGNVQWAGVDDTYFGMIAVPTKPTTGLEYRTIAYEHKTDGKVEQRFLVTGLVPVSTDGAKTEIYAGPKDHRLLAAASEDIKQLGGPQVDLGEAINFGFLGSMRRFLAVPILFAIDRLQRITGSYGVAIILFTIFIYSLFFPLKWQSSRKMKKAQKYAPRMKELQEKLKGMKSTDPKMKELQMEQLRLMKEANPLGGCLPLLIQMPFLFALYSAITISIDFRQASFLWIPDLSGPEPYILGFIRILPLLFASSMIILQLMTPAPSADPMQRKMMAIGMPMMMLYILWSAPAGLLIYWLVGNIVGFLQQFIINRMTRSEDEGPPPDAKGTKKKPPKLKPAEA